MLSLQFNVDVVLHNIYISLNFGSKKLKIVVFNKISMRLNVDIGTLSLSLSPEKKKRKKERQKKKKAETIKTQRWGQKVSNWKSQGWLGVEGAQRLTKNRTV